MKKIYFFLIFSFSIFTLWAQIEVDANGHVGIGGAVPNSTYDVNINTARLNSTIEFPHNYGGIKIVNTTTPFGPYKMIYPTWDNRGSVGSSNYAFKYMYSYAFITTSDIRSKENIRPAVDNLSILTALDVFRYDYKASSRSDTDNELKSEEISLIEEDRKNKIGLMAQEVEKVFPEAVVYDDSTDLYGIDYTKFIPILIGAMKEQQQIEELKSQVEILQRK